MQLLISSFKLAGSIRTWKLYDLLCLFSLMCGHCSNAGWLGKFVLNCICLSVVGNWLIVLELRSEMMWCGHCCCCEDMVLVCYCSSIVGWVSNSALTCIRLSVVGN
uniref:Uncharacterized protein n=1 Tax=Setaria viridis TaxID=4556 RepID=A0A4U6V9C2_SETVI|nr:hypothetical protein SEVIR_4G089400v2 [Setaria viridis]